MSIYKNKRFYIISIATLAVLSGYPLVNGIRMAVLNAVNGALEPEQYAKYVVPYAAICAAVLLFAVLRPVYQKAKRLELPIGLGVSYGAFFAVERFLEAMQIRVTDMTLIDAATLAPGAAGAADPTADIWQASLCIASPELRQQSLTYASRDSFFYVIGNAAYKVHYYLISLILITMVCGLVYGIAKMIRTGDAGYVGGTGDTSGTGDIGGADYTDNTGGTDNATQTKSIYLRGASTAAIVALCVFANTTAFFRKAAPIQTPLASILTGLFFVILGAAAGVYIGSCLLKKGKAIGTGLPVALSFCVAVLMYVGEAAMMSGNLYRFGTGWFFRGIPSIALAPVDILIILLSGALAWLVLIAAHKRGRGRGRRRELGEQECEPGELAQINPGSLDNPSNSDNPGSLDNPNNPGNPNSPNNPGKRAMIAAVAICAAVAVAGPVIATATAPKNIDDVVAGCYVFDKNIYTSPLSSTLYFGGLPYVYAFDGDAFVIASTGGGLAQAYTVERCKTPVGADEFKPNSESFFSPPSLEGFRERYLLAVMSNSYGPKYGLYSMDGEIWLADISKSVGIWCIHRLARTEATTLADIRRAMDYYANNPPIETMPGSDVYENQMTLKDVYALARKGDALTLGDFDPYFYWLTGADFTGRLYNVVGADTVSVRAKDGKIESATLLSRRKADHANVIDLREGFGAVAAYMDPLAVSIDVKIDKGPKLDGERRELLFEDDYFGSECRYYLNSSVAQAYATFSRDERMTVAAALQERRIAIEDAVANGLGDVYMIPIDNPLGGEFMVLLRHHTFMLNGEAFYPSRSFMYVVWGDDISVYYDIDELAELLEWYGYASESANLRRSIAPADIAAIAGGSYVREINLAKAGIDVDNTWMLSSSRPTPVLFSVAY